MAVLVLHQESLSAEVHFPETLACADKAFVCLATEGNRGALLVGINRAETQWQGIVTGRREMIVAEGDGLCLVAIRVEGDEGSWLWRW